MERIKSGQTEQSFYREEIIEIQELFGGIKPREHFYQNLVTGKSNIESASAAIYGIYYHFLPLEWIESLLDLVREVKYDHINVMVQT